MSENNVSSNNSRHPLITLALLTAGTQLGSTVIKKMGKHPAILFSMGIASGIYCYKNRKLILEESRHIKSQGKKLLSIANNDD